MLKKAVFLMVLLYLPLVFASSFSGTSAVKYKKEDFKQSKCANVATKFTEFLSYDEVCKYNKSGCPIKNTGKKVRMYCSRQHLSECFENKDWKTANQIVQLPDTVEIGLLTQGLSFQQGAKAGKTCAYYELKD